MAKEKLAKAAKTVAQALREAQLRATNPGRNAAARASNAAKLKPGAAKAKSAAAKAAKAVANKAASGVKSAGKSAGKIASKLGFKAKLGAVKLSPHIGGIANKAKVATKALGTAFKGVGVAGKVYMTYVAAQLNRDLAHQTVDAARAITGDQNAARRIRNHMNTLYGPNATPLDTLRQAKDTVKSGASGKYTKAYKADTGGTLGSEILDAVKSARAANEAKEKRGNENR